jgi:hypothetical protein
VKNIFCVAFFLGIIFTSLPLSFAESDSINKIQRSHSLIQDDPTASSFGTRLNTISEEFSEVSVTAVLPDYPWVRVSGYRGFLTEKCVSCHRGISQVGKSHPLSFGCTVCHGGDGNAEAKEIAHETLIYDPKAKTGKRNPSSFSVVDKTCGQAYCHSGHSQKDRNHIERVKKSMMGTLAGMISGLRYQWGAQGHREANYGVRAVEDKDAEIPLRDGALSKLKALPIFSNKEASSSITKPIVSRHIGDSLLKDRCFQCHIDSPGGPENFRSQGCAACHFTYAKDGLYKGEDLTVSRTESGHPARHKMITLTPDSVCSQCHRGYQTTKNFLNNGVMSATSAISSPGFGEIRQDVHIEAGLECIDCHTQFDIMGDGNIYSKQHQAVEIRCETCHGNADSRPLIAQVKDPLDRVVRLARSYTEWRNSIGDWMALSSRQRKMTNVKVIKGEVVTLGKRSGKIYKNPLTADAIEDHSIPAHKNKLECTSCHSQWVPDCKGCHATFMPKKSGGGKPWSAITSQTINVKSPSLMVGPRGKVTSMITPERRLLNIFDQQGNPIPVIKENGDAGGLYREWSFTNPHGYSGGHLAYALNPHSVGKKVRTCASCHISVRALGLGEGDINIGVNSSGKDDKFLPLVKTDIISGRSELGTKARLTLQGKPVAGISQPGARLFNQEEITRILKVGNCLPCHDKSNDPIYQDINKSYLFEKTLDHRNLRTRILSYQ